MFSHIPDRIEITSPGGLPKGMDKEAYLRGGISILRNRIIGSIFFRLHMIERFGTGVKRIKEEYRESKIKPVFDMTENTIRIILPVIEAGGNLTEDENKVYKLLRGREMPSSSISEAVGFGKNKTVNILKSLVEKGYANVSGKGRGIRYLLK
nr:ATP-binding protein [Selenomonas sp.]